MAEKEKKGIPLTELVARIDKGFGQSREADAPVQTRAHGKHQYIKFMMEDILMAIPLTSASEIGRQPRVTPLPHLPGWVLGVSNIRGEIISVVDLKAFFGLNPPELHRSQRFIIIFNQDMKVGITVDRIMGIFYLDQSGESGQRLYQKSEARWTSYVSEVVSLPEGLLNVLDVDSLLSSSQMNAFHR
jgi:purine-binding chemotaxis protein CheW